MVKLVTFVTFSNLRNLSESNKNNFKNEPKIYSERMPRWHSGLYSMFYSKKVSTTMSYI